MGSPGGSGGKEFACIAGDPGSIPRSGKSPGEGKCLPTPVFLPGEFHRQWRLASDTPLGHKESDTTERLFFFKKKKKKKQFLAYCRQ